MTYGLRSCNCQVAIIHLTIDTYDAKMVLGEFRFDCTIVENFSDLLVTVVLEFQHMRI